MNQPETLIHHILKLKQLDSSLIAVKAKVEKKWKHYSWHEYYKMVEKIGNAFLALGIQRGDRVALISQTRPEWSYFDFGIMGCGAITLPIYPNSVSEEAEYILLETEAKFVVLENRTQLEKWEKIKDKCPFVKKVVCIDEKNKGENFLSFSSFLEKGLLHKKQNPNQFIESCQSSHLDSVATIIYTSGTTGSPKGVVITHKQILSEIEDAYSLLPISQKDTFLSFLPFAHVLGRLECWGHIYKNCTLAFAESVETLGDNIQEIKPTILISVPRIYEKIYNSLLLKVEKSPLKLKLFLWAKEVGLKKLKFQTQKRPIPFWISLQYKLAFKFVFSKLHKKMGNRLRFTISGGAPLSQGIIEFFHAAGLKILEGYGLTETTAAVCVNTIDEIEFGTVGKPIGDVEIKFGEDQEILIRSNKVMKEYYRNKKITQKVFTEDGFFKSGDIGEWTQRGFLKITDRKKDLIKTSGGKYIAPQKLENLLKMNKYISQVFIHGNRRKYIVALITLEEQSIKDFLKKSNIGFKNLKELVEKKEVIHLIQVGVNKVNETLSSFETIKKFSILDHQFTIENGGLTPSLKVKRKFCDQKYAEILNKLYGEDRRAL